ncbi:MAG: hypothetical protein ACREMG_00030 [Gemmatimonadales bacterium]
MRLIPFHEEHLWGLEADLRHNQDARDLLRAHPELLSALQEHCWTLEHAGEILGCGGRVPRAGGGWSWWVLLTPAAWHRAVGVTRTLRHHLEHSEGRHYAHAVDPAAGEYLEVLGFLPLGQQEHGFALYERAA